MGNVLRSPVNNNAILLVPRTGSHSLTTAAIHQWWPSTDLVDSKQHPACWIPVQENWDGTNQNIGIIVRNPIDRLLSTASKYDLRTEDKLIHIMCSPLPKGNFVKYFKFETQLDEAASWLGLSIPIPKEDASPEENKPKLTPEQISKLREFYAEDIALWESL